MCGQRFPAGNFLSSEKGKRANSTSCGASVWIVKMPNLGQTTEAGLGCLWLRKICGPVVKGNPLVVVQPEKLV